MQRILEVNEQLPAEKKIRVISMSVGWGPSQKGYEQITEVTNKAKAAGMLVICSSVQQVHGFAFDGLGRSAMANPDDFNSYGPGSWWAGAFHKGDPLRNLSNWLLVPMDARTTASPTGASEYVFYAQDGWSWSIPYIAPSILAAPETPVPKDFAAKIDGLDIDKATRKDVIEQLGKPLSYVLGDQPLDANSLPDRCAMIYPAGVQVIIAEDHIHRIAILAPGYLFRDKIQVGSSLEEVFEVLGPPGKTIEHAKGQDVAMSQEGDVFYKDINSMKGTCLYRAQAKGVAVWLADGHVRQLMLLPKK